MAAPCSGQEAGDPWDPWLRADSALEERRAGVLRSAPGWEAQSEAAGPGLGGVEVVEAGLEAERTPGTQAPLLASPAGRASDWEVPVAPLASPGEPGEPGLDSSWPPHH